MLRGLHCVSIPEVGWRRVVTHTVGCGRRALSLWHHVPKGPEDGNKATTAAFKADPSPKKVNLGEGIYKNDQGKTWVLDSVRKAERLVVAQNLDMEYAPIAGIPNFVKAAKHLAFGAENPAVQEGRIVSVQSLSGTGALRVGATFLSRYLPPTTPVFISDPTWVNHLGIFGHAGFTDVRKYRYYNRKTNELDFDGMCEDFQNAPSRSVLVLHASAHNPTGLDPTQAQWNQLSKICMERNHVCYFDSAYQGFASGNPVTDSFAYCKFLEDGHDVLVAQSFAKSFGLYGQRAGALHLACASKKEAEAIESQLKIVIRPMYSNPPLHGARIVMTILNDPELSKTWYQEIEAMSSRLRSMRVKLVASLAKAGSQRNWNHIPRQIGMFAFSGLTPDQVARCAKDFHIYMNKDGRIAIAGLNTSNVDYVGECFHAVTKE